MNLPSAFEIEAHDHSISFPCSLCKKNTQPARTCESTCRFYSFTMMEAFDLKKEVERRIAEAGK